MGRSTEQQNEYDRAIDLAKGKLEFILDNEKGLLRVRNGQNKLEAAESFWDRIEAKKELTPGMLSYIDGIYEATCKGSGLPHMNVHIDKKRKGLNFGHQ